MEAQNNLNYDPNERSGDVLPAMIHAFLNNNLYYTRGHVAQRHENGNLKSKSKSVMWKLGAFAVHTQKTPVCIDTQVSLGGRFIIKHFLFTNHLLVFVPVWKQL